jgi:uncharacterized protein (TIGR03067 family)
MRKSAVLLSAVVSLAFAPAPLPRPDTGKDDLKKMQGTWEVIDFRYGGRPSAAGVGKVVITGDRMTYHTQAGGISTQWGLELDAKQSPRAFVWKRLGPPSDVAFWGRYLLDKDTLTICYASKRAERPGHLDGKKADQRVEVLRRVNR